MCLDTKISTSAGTSSSCTDVPPPPGQYTCAQQASFGQCQQSWMQGYCYKSCQKCSSPSPSPSPSPQRPSSAAATPIAAPAPSGGKFTPQQTKAAVAAEYFQGNDGHLLPFTGQISVQLPAPPKGVSGVCNSYVPSDSIFNRFVYVVQFFARNGFYIILDNQLNFDTTVLQSQSAWIQVLSRTVPECMRPNRRLNDGLNAACRAGNALQRP